MLQSWISREDWPEFRVTSSEVRYFTTVTTFNSVVGADSMSKLWFYDDPLIGYFSTLLYTKIKKSQGSEQKIAATTRPRIPLLLANRWMIIVHTTAAALTTQIKYERCHSDVGCPSLRSMEEWPSDRLETEKNKNDSWKESKRTETVLPLSWNNRLLSTSSRSLTGIQWPASVAAIRIHRHSPSRAYFTPAISVEISFYQL